MIKKEDTIRDVEPIPEPTIIGKERLMSMEEYARLIGVTRHTVYNMIKDERVQVRKVSKKKFIIIK